jgi:RND family efflux transporter MFP subunit
MPLKAGDVLFRIDPVPFKASADALEAQLRFQELRLSQMTQLQERQAGRAFDVEQRQAEVDQLKAQVEGAKYNLEQTVVRAPTDGYVTNLALRKGARVTDFPVSPVMAFIDTSETIIGVTINQNDARYIALGQSVELTFKFFPGRIFSGRVQSVLQAVATGQIQTSGTAVAPTAVQAVPFVIRVTMDDTTAARQLPAGAAGDAAIFTSRVKPAHVIRKVLLRQIAILNYVWPY